MRFHRHAASALVAAGLVVGALGGTAHAAEKTTVGVQNGLLTVRAPAGPQQDQIRVDFGGGDVRVTDEVNPLASAGQCVTAGSGHTVHCPLGLVFSLRIETGDGHDLIVNRLGGVGDGVSRFVTINAGSGNDTVIDDNSNANLDGGPGNDALTPGFGRDVVVGGTGVDGANYSDHNVPVTVKLDGLGFDGANQEFDDVANDVENLSGTFQADVLIGNASNNWLYGGGGNDILRGDGGNDLIQGGAGNDTIDGGLGTDTATYIDHSGNVRVTLRSGLCAGHINLECDSVLLGTVENVIGGSGSDQLYGDDGPNVLLGGSGNDELVGFGGNDTLIGEGGPSDRASGGLGVDSCQAEFVSLSCP